MARILILFILSVFSLEANQCFAQTYPDWHCLSTDEIVFDMKFENQNTWIASRGGLVKIDRQTGVSTYYNAANSGLTCNEIACLEVDTDFNIWIGTYYNGLIKFDGSNWTNIPILLGTDTLMGIRQMRKYPNGNLLIYAYVKPNNFYLYQFDGLNFNKIPFLINDYFFDLEVDSLNQIWAGGYYGLYKHDGTNWTLFDSTNSPLSGMSVQRVEIDNSNNIWLLDNAHYSGFQDTNRLYMFDGTNWNHITPVMTGFPETNYYNINIDDSNYVWLYSGNLNGLYQYDGSVFNYISPASISMPGNSIWSFQIDTAGHYWVAIAANRDTLIYENTGNSWTPYLTSNSPIKSAYGNTITIDQEGNRWFCSDRDGMQKFDGFNWITYDTIVSGISSNTVSSVAFDNNGNMWVCSDDNLSGTPALCQFDGVTWNSYPLSFFGTVPMAIKAKADLLNNVWIGVRGYGVARYDGLNWSYFDKQNIGTSSFFVFDLDVDLNNNLWVASYGDGLIKYNGSNWTVFSTTNSNIPSNYITSVFTDDSNKVWLFSDMGLTMFDGINWIQFDSTNSSMEGFPITMAQDHSGNYWIGTDKGLTKYDGINWINYNMYNSGVGGAIGQIEIDSRNTLWMVGQAGVFIYKENGLTPFDFYNFPQAKFEGRVYYDSNSNGIFDTITESGLASQKIVSFPDSIVSFTNAEGNYRFYKDSGCYQSSYIPYSNWNLTSDSAFYSICIDSISLAGFDFGTNATSQIEELEISMAMGGNRCNTIVPCWINYENKGTTILNGTVQFIKNDSTVFISAVPAPSSINGDTITWNYAQLLPFETRNINSLIKNPGMNATNNTLISNVIMSSVSGLSEMDSIFQNITCSYDPNNKSVNPEGLGPLHITTPGDTLEYTIRFQNLGNDTAVDVVILDSISVLMDKNSFELLGSSHPVSVTILKGGVLRFLFENILLPYKQINEPASNGYVKYKLAPQPNLPLNSIINNMASIYFDFNTAINTNVVFNIYSTSGVGIEQDQTETKWNYFPNPCNNDLWIQMYLKQEPVSEIKIFNTLGHLVYLDEQSTNLIHINMGSYAAGMYFIELRNGNQWLYGKIIRN